MRITPALADTGRASRWPLLAAMHRDIRDTDTLTRPTALLMWGAYTVHATATTRALLKSDRRLPLPSAIAVPVGLSAAVAGVALCVGGMSRFSGIGQLEGTQPQEFTTTGVYRSSRNPQYAGYVLALGGAAIARRSLTGLGLAALVGLAYDSWIPVEERQLLDRHGPTYREYAATTPRWLGRPAMSTWDSRCRDWLRSTGARTSVFCRGSLNGRCADDVS